MKRALVILLLAICATAYSQQQANLGLIPTPQRVEMQQGSCNPSKAKTKEQKVTQLPVEANSDQAYGSSSNPRR